MQTNFQQTLNQSSPYLAGILLLSLSLLLILSPSTTTTTTTVANVGPTCDLFTGRWVPQNSPTLYSNVSCGTLPSSKNCALHGRPDDGFLHWKWAPQGPGCQLAAFDALGFLELVAGKTVAFVGDSIARNHVDSLICMLATADVAVHVYKDAKDRSRTWYFPRHNFTLMVLWSRFLVKHKERGINGFPTGIYDLHLDQPDESWATMFQLSHPRIHYAIISDAQWFFKQNYLYENNQLLGCTYCNETNITDLGPVFAIRRALATSLGHIITQNKNASYPKSVVTLVRTISPSHFEGGTWRTGGRCEKRRPSEAEELNGGLDLEVRKAQVEEVERAKREGKNLRLVFEALDITWAMLMRPDGHPGQYWRDKRKKGYNDCVHWCLPGPIDTWNELLFAILKRLV